MDKLEISWINWDPRGQIAPPWINRDPRG